MYLLTVVGLMFVFPVVSIGIEILGFGEGASAADVVAKWFVFWGVGVRLLTAGLRQMLQPRYTARTVLGLRHQESLIVIRELGFANTATGTLGVMSIFVSGWTLASAVVGAVFFGLAGANHILQTSRNKSENIAMATDSLFAVLLLALCLLLVL